MEMIYKVMSPLDFKTTEVILQSRLMEQGFGVLWSLNFKDKLAEKGLELEGAKNFMVMEVCNPMLAAEVFKINMDAGFFLPCKVVVYDLDEEDVAFMGLVKPTWLINFFKDDRLNSIAQQVEEAIKTAMEAVEEGSDGSVV